MALVIPEGYAHVIHSLRWSGDPELMAVTYGVSIDGGVVEGDLSTIATALSQAMKTALQGRINLVIQHVGVELRAQLAALPAPPVIGASGDTWTGTESSDNVLPQNSAFLVHKRTSHGGRSGRGRFFFPGVGETLVDNLGNIASGTLTAWNTALNNWATGIVGVTGVGNIMLLHDSTGAGAALDPYGVTSMQLDSRIATQRRRLRR